MLYMPEGSPMSTGALKAKATVICDYRGRARPRAKLLLEEDLHYFFNANMYWAMRSSLRPLSCSGC